MLCSSPRAKSGTWKMPDVAWFIIAFVFASVLMRIYFQRRNNG